MYHVNGIKVLVLTLTYHVHHAFLYISLSSLHDYDLKQPNFTFYGGREHKITNIWHIKGVGIRAVNVVCTILKRS